MKCFFLTTVDSIPKDLNRVVCLQKLTKLDIHCFNFSFQQIIKLIRYTPNLHTLKINVLPFIEINSRLIQQSRIFQYVSNTNRIKYLDFHENCTLKQIQFIVKLFPKLEYLKIGMKKVEIHQIVHFLLSKK